MISAHPDLRHEIGPEHYDAFYRAAERNDVPALEAMLVDNGKRAKRERLTYQRIFEELKVAGYAGGYDNVRRYARQ